ncbi:hypothetical protein AB3M83_12270 [Microbacterium sp. 179-B 1A2 NHS]|uniref:hypothetical protein n=1 Tax=Microbacterium sp. 179-B 1A2 NHS TaxID=3142383 RepID=UPI0039A29305
MDGLTHAGDGPPWLAGHAHQGDEVRSLSGGGTLGVAEQIVVAAETFVGPTGSLPPTGAIADGVPVLARGAASVIPLSWRPSPAPADAFAARANELWTAVRAACEHRHGAALSVDLGDGGSRNGYVRELNRTGVRRADWWESGGAALVLVVHGPPLPARPTATALHVVPLGWVSERRPSRTVGPAELSWSGIDLDDAHEGRRG